jgi:phosphodiesterase/alkaline phosphatase D-like protein
MHSLLHRIAFSILLALASIAAHADIAQGPLVQAVTADQAGVWIRTSVDQQARVMYWGPDGVVSITPTVATHAASDDTASFLLGGLAPGSTYTYQVGTTDPRSGLETWSGRYTFGTMGSDVQSLDIAVLADFKNKLAPSAALAAGSDFESLSYGNLVQVFLLDARSARDGAQPGGATPMLGACQHAWLVDGLHRSKATWKIVLSPVPLNPTMKTWDAVEPMNCLAKTFPDSYRTDGLQAAVYPLDGHSNPGYTWIRATRHSLSVTIRDADGNVKQGVRSDRVRTPMALDLSPE